MISYSNCTEQFNQFNKNYKSKEVEVSGVTWNYIGGGHGSETIFIIPIGTGMAEDLFKYILDLEDNYRVIAPTFPVGVTTVSDYIGGIIAILNSESVEKAHFVGFDIGGMIEQCFVRQYPEKVSNLILIHTVVPDVAMARSMRISSALDSLIPSFLYLKMSKSLFSKVFEKQLDLTIEDQKFWLNLYASAFSKKRQHNWYDIINDYLKNYHFNSSDLDRWQGNVFIIESDKDKIFGKKEIHEQIKEIYPNAQIHTFYEGSFIGNSIFKVGTIVPLIKDFLSRNKR